MEVSEYLSLNQSVYKLSKSGCLGKSSTTDVALVFSNLDIYIISLYVIVLRVSTKQVFTVHYLDGRFRREHCQFCSARFKCLSEKVGLLMSGWLVRAPAERSALSPILLKHAVG